jgi:hypothetical protein
MTFLNGDHLRIVSVITVDGVRPKLDETGQQMFKETLLPLTARKNLEERNQGLPKHLKMKIEVVKSVQDVSDQQPQPAQGAKSEPPAGNVRRLTMGEAQHLKKHLS